MARKRKKVGECVYCGAVGPITRDHVPPRGIFPEPRPDNLVTVPSCLNCNRGASEDDEYFRIIISGLRESSGHPAAERVQKAVIEGLKRPRGAGLLHRIKQSVRQVPQTTRGGIYLGDHPAFDVDVPRINSVATRIVKGLFYIHEGRRLPDDYQVGVELQPALELFDSHPVVYEQFVQPLLEQPMNGIGGDVFAWSVGFLSGDRNVSIWTLAFYGRRQLLCVTAPKNIRPRPT